MPHFRVEALEKCVVRTAYEVEAETVEEAERLCRSRQAAYEKATIEEGNEEWLETISIEAV